MYVLSKRTEADPLKKSRFHVSIRRLWTRDFMRLAAHDLQNKFPKLHELSQRRAGDLEHAKRRELHDNLSTSSLNPSHDTFITCIPPARFDGNDSPPDNMLNDQDAERKISLSSNVTSVILERYGSNSRDTLNRNGPSTPLYSVSSGPQGTEFQSSPVTFLRPGQVLSSQLAPIDGKDNCDRTGDFILSSFSPYLPETLSDTPLPNNLTQIKTSGNHYSAMNEAQLSSLSKIPEINTYDAPFSSPLTQELPPKEVSIQTVELVAAAKIYLETRYNELFSRMSKSIENTSETLERRRHGCDMANNTHTMAHEKFRNPDSDYLRLFRALKTHRKTKVTKFNQVSDYEVIRLLGKGSFGAVQLVRNKGDISSINNMLPIDAITNDACRHYPQNAGVVHSSVYAMKVIRKSDMLRKGQEGHLRAERDFLVASEHSHWVVPLIECFQDNNHLYLVMEYMIGGDFLGLLQRYKILSEEMARFYLAEMILCIEEVHRMNWIHRDIKPDNFLISSSGHLKISDFGLAFDGHWCHNQKYFIESRYSVLEKLGVEIMGDARDIEEAKLCEKLEFDCSDETKPKSASPKGKTTRPEGHLLLDSLNISWKRKLAKSVVGTSQYMAPEVIKGEEYDGRCD